MAKIKTSTQVLKDDTIVDLQGGSIADRETVVEQPKRERKRSEKVNRGEGKFKAPTLLV